jgi:hypothetical protein
MVHYATCKLQQAQSNNQQVMREYERMAMRAESQGKEGGGGVMRDKELAVSINGCTKSNKDLPSIHDSVCD